MLKRKMAVLLAFVLMISSFISPVSAQEKKEDKIYYWKVYTTDIAKGEEDQIEWINPTIWKGKRYCWFMYWRLGYDAIEFHNIDGENYVIGSNQKTLGERKIGDTFYDIESWNANVHERELNTTWTPLQKNTIRKIDPFTTADVNHYNVDVDTLYAYKHIGYARSYDKNLYEKYELEKYGQTTPPDYRFYYKVLPGEPTGDVKWINDDNFQEEQKRRNEGTPGSQDDKEKIKELENKISEKEGIISDLEKRTGESEKAVENLKKEISKLEKEISDLKGDKEKEIPALKEKLDNLKTEKDKIEKDLKNRDNLIDDLKREIEELKKEATEKGLDSNKDLSNKIDELKNKADDLNSKNDKLKKDLDEANGKISDLEKKLEAEKDKNNDLEKDLADKDNKVSNLGKELTDAQDKINDLNKKIKELENKISNLPAGNTNEASDTQNELNKLKDEKAKLDNDANAKDKIIEDLKKEIKELKKLIGSKDPVPKDLEDKANNLGNKTNDLDSKNKKIKKDLDEVGNKLSGLEKALNDKKNTPSPSDKEKEDLKRKLEESDKKIKDLNNKVDELNKRSPERDYPYDYFYFRNLDRRNYDLNQENQELQEKNKELKKEIENLTERQSLGPRTVEEDYVTVFGIKKDVYKTYLNSELLSQDEMVDNKGTTAPFIKDNRTMLPIRYVALSLGLDVHWDKETRIATFTNTGNNNVLKPSKVTINANTFEMRDKNGNIIQVDSAPILKDGRFYVSITNISKAFGGSHGTTTDGIRNTIEWDKENRKVLVYRYTK